MGCTPEIGNRHSVCILKNNSSSLLTCVFCTFVAPFAQTLPPHVLKDEENGALPVYQCSVCGCAASCLGTVGSNNKVCGGHAWLGLEGIPS
jgi:hypothetical protein